MFAIAAVVALLGVAAIAVAALFLQITPGEVPWYTGPLHDTWIGVNGMSWLAAAVVGGALYAAFGLRSAAGAR